MRHFKDHVAPKSDALDEMQSAAGLTSQTERANVSEPNNHEVSFWFEKEEGACRVAVMVKLFHSANVSSRDRTMIRCR